MAIESEFRAAIRGDVRDCTDSSLGDLLEIELLPGSPSRDLGVLKLTMHGGSGGYIEMSGEMAAVFCMKLHSMLEVENFERLVAVEKAVNA